MPGQSRVTRASASITANTDGTYRVTASGSHTYTTNSSTIQASLILVDTSTTFPQSRVVPLKTTLDQVPDTTEIFLYNNLASADDPKVEAIFHVAKNPTAHQGAAIEFRLLNSNGTPTGVSLWDTINEGLASAEFTLPSRRAGKQFKVATILGGITYTSESVEIIPGVAAQMKWFADVGGSRQELPSGSTGLPLNLVIGNSFTVLVEPRDNYGNRLADGTLVGWQDFGLVKHADAINVSSSAGDMISELKGGRASLTFPRGVAPLFLKLGARVDELETERQVIGAPLNQIQIATSGNFIYLDSPAPITVTVTPWDVNGQLLPSGTAVTITDSMGMIQANTVELVNGVATVTMVASASHIGGRTTGLNYINATVAGVTVSGSVAHNYVQVQRSPWHASGGEGIDVDRHVLSYNGSGDVVEIERPHDDAMAYSQVNATLVTATNLNPNTSYRIYVDGVRGNAIYLANSPANHYQAPRPNTLDVPAGATTYSTYLFTDGFDAASRQGMQRVRVILQDWSYGLDPVSGNYRFGWWEVRTTDSAETVVVGDKDVATAVETGVGIVGEFFWGAVVGSDGLDAGLAGDMSVSLIPVIGVYADIRDLAKNIWRFHGLSTKPVDGMETALAALGIVGEFFPPADYFVDGARFAWKVIKHFRHTRSAAQAAQIMLVLEPFIEGAITELWNRAFGPADAYAHYPPSTPPLYGGGLPPGSPEGLRAEGLGPEDFWDALVTMLGGIGPKSKVAAQVLNAVRQGDPDFLESVALITAREGKRAHRLLERMVDGMDVEFDKVLGAALRKSRLAGGGGDEAFAHGIKALGQALSYSKPPSTELVNRLRALARTNPNDVAELIIKMGRAYTATGVSDGRIAKALTNIFAKFNGAADNPLQMARKLFDDSATAADQVASGATTVAEKAQSRNAIQSLIKSVGNSEVPFAYGAMRGAFYEIHDFVTNALPKKVMNATLSKGNSIEQITDAVGKRIVNGVEKRVAREAMLFGAGVKPETKKRKLDQFRQYAANADNQPPVVDIVEYAFPDQPTADRFVAFLQSSGAFGTGGRPT